MKKLLSILSTMIVSGTAMPNIIASSNYSKAEHKIKKRQAPPSLQKIFLPKVIKKTKLGHILTNSEENILNQVVRLNKNINKNDIAVARLLDNQAQIVLRENLENNIFSQNNFIWVTFEPEPDVAIQEGNSVFYNYFPNKDNLNKKCFTFDVFDKKSNFNIGIIPNNNGRTIMEYVRRSLPIFQDTVEVWTDTILEDIRVSSATLLIRINNQHTERILITFTPERINLNSIITNPNLGKINSFNVLGEIYKLYPQLRNTSIFVGFESTTVASIFVSDDNPVYFGSVSVYFENNTDSGVNVTKKDNKKDDDDFSDNFKSNKWKEKKITKTTNLEAIKMIGDIPTREECSETSENKLANSLIWKNINLNWEIIGPITNDKKLEQKNINLLKWSDYANSAKKFKEKYKHIRFNDFSAQAGGQGTTVFNKKNIEFNTKDIDKKENYLPIIKYDFINYVPVPFINYVEQSARLYINNLFFEGEYLKASIISHTYSWMAIYHVWTKLNIKTVEFY